MMDNLLKCQNYIATKTRIFFHQVGLYIACKPWRTIVISLLVSFGLMSCILLGFWEVRYEYRDSPRKNPSFKIYEEIIVETFGDSARIADMIVELSEDDGGDEGNILEKANILKAFDVHLQVLNLTVDDTGAGDKTIEYSDVCLQSYSGGPCAFDSAFKRLGLTYDNVQNMTQSEINEKFVAGASEVDLSLHLVVGGLEVSTNASSGIVEARGKSLRFMHYTSLRLDANSRKIYDLLTNQVTDPREADVLAWEGRFLEFLCMTGDCPARDDGLLITAMAERSILDELNRNGSSSTPYMGMALILILVIMWLMIGGRPFQRSRLGLGVGALLVMLLSMGAGFGITSLLQIPLTEISLVLVFVVFGIGVDDVIVVVDFVKQQEGKGLPLVDRIAKGLERAGPTIFLTSFTNLLAFFVASIIDFPGVRWFCSAAGIILFMLFILTVTLFTAMLTLDERRRDEKRYDCLCCLSYASSSDSTSQKRIDQDGLEKDGEFKGRVASLAETISKQYFKLISHKAFAILIVCAFISLIPIGFAFAVPKLQVGADFETYFPDQSYFTEFRRTAESNFVSLGNPAMTIFESIDISDPTVQDQVKSLLSDLDKGNIIIVPHISWLADYEAYAYDYNNNAVSNYTLPLSGEGYYNALESFLQITENKCVQKSESGECIRNVIPASYANDIVFSRNADGINSVDVTRLNCVIKDTESTDGNTRIMDKHKDNLASSLRLYDSLDEDNTMVWSTFWMFRERDQNMTFLLTTTLVFAALAILGTLMFFLHPISVLIIAVSIASIDGALFIVMYILGIPIDTVSFLVLAMSIGLSVDYVVHVAHSFEHEDGTPNERLQKALSGIGMSVAKGGMSTFLGVVALAFAPSEVYRTFFKLLFSTVILGLFAGLVFFPACTVLIGHLICPKRYGLSK